MHTFDTDFEGNALQMDVYARLYSRGNQLCSTISECSFGCVVSVIAYDNGLAPLSFPYSRPIVFTIGVSETVQNDVFLFKIQPKELYHIWEATDLFV